MMGREADRHQKKLPPSVVRRPSAGSEYKCQFQTPLQNVESESLLGKNNNKVSFKCMLSGKVPQEIVL